MKKNKIIMVLALSILYSFPVQAKVKNYIVTTNNKNYVYSLNDLQISFINYKTGTGDTSLYDKFKINISEGTFLAFQDESDKYVSYEDVVDTYMQSKLGGSAFDIDRFVENANGIKLDLNSINVEISDPINNTSNLPIINDNTDITNKFTDKNFKSAIYKIIGKKNSQPLLYSNIKDIKSLDVSNKDISSLNGIEYFKSLEKLKCNDNKLSTLHLSKNIELTYLECTNNQLVSLDISKSPKLFHLDCTNNQIRTLDITQDTDLATAYLGSNKLTSLDVSRNTKLNELICYKNELTNLDVSKNINLKALLIHTNKLKNLDVSKSINLTHLACDENQLTALDVSKNTELSYLSCSENELTSLEVSKNKKLFELHCDDNKLKILNVTENPKLYWLFCRGNQLTSIDISKNKVLENFRYDDNVTVVK